VQSGKVDFRNKSIVAFRADGRDVYRGADIIAAAAEWTGTISRDLRGRFA
jgi:hypothetical protein